MWENPKVGFKAASGFWIAGRYDMGDDIKKTCHQSFFAYEKDGILYEFEPSRVWEMSQKTIAEYALKHGADRVYCYQALTVCYLGIWRGNPRPFNDRDESAARYTINLPKA